MGRRWRCECQAQWTTQSQGVNQRMRQMFIRTTGTISADLATKANIKKGKQSFEEMVATWLHDYKSIFDKADFDEMPPHHPWDHQIELEEAAKLWDNVCLIPLSNDKTDVLDEFLNKNLWTRRIQETVGFTILFCTKERWKTLTSTGSLTA
jgi:hypothetical protein